MPLISGWIFLFKFSADLQKTRHFKWAVEIFIGHLMAEERVMGIMDSFLVQLGARAGDIISVQLTNKLHTEGVVIHWHGIRQKTGTYFYHGHYGMQRSAGLYGSLRDVAQGEREPFHYDGEFNILLRLCMHGSHRRVDPFQSSSLDW
ncbi:hypothetical protein HAX54_026488 [Datura stramonium]|uniref:Plastocyanin-like domain-containing protein n=1 Tax=Datura stramonium TaxID=4076 RepID=A0ABS8V126_DATST|nr:hypothetical protein [Datura stramonium]